MEQLAASSAFIESSKLKTVKIPVAHTIGYGAFGYCYWLKTVEAPVLKTIISAKTNYNDGVVPAFEQCYSLTEIDLPMAENLPNGCFGRCISLETVNLPKVQVVEGSAFNETRSLKSLALPSAISIGEMVFNSSGVQDLYAPSLQSAQSLPVAENARVVLSSAFTACSIDATGYDLTIYGTSGTFSESYAQQYGLDFVELPILLSQPEAMYTDSDTKLAVEVFGFNPTYQWYGTSTPDNRTGTPIAGATEAVFAPQADHAYPYYYCVITTTDGEYVRELRTGLTQDLISKANYSNYNQAVRQAQAINRSLYTDLSALDAALAVDVSGLPITQQAVVEAQTKAIADALAALEYLPADLTALNQAVEGVPADLSQYTQESVERLNALLADVPQYADADITKQAEIDALAKQITDAIAALENAETENVLTEPTTGRAQDATNPGETEANNPNTGGHSGRLAAAFGLFLLSAASVSCLKKRSTDR